jgi:Tol biopolymer transport system component/predicted Ser/Thr protein kinase
MTTSPGTRLGPYEILARIGAGGMGEVFRARDTRLDRSVAIKVLPAEFAQNAQLKVRFEREARAISQLEHPHICRLYDVGDDYLVMELLEGETLADRTARGPLPLADVLKYGAQIADALDRAHRAGIVHRDLKPGNVMITKTGAKLLDFGLAKTVATMSNPEMATVQRDKALTQEGTILGTFQYMAPEQLEGEEADPRTDLFALGAVLYEMSTGRRAFDGKTKTSLIAAIVGAQPQPVSELMPLSPPALDHVIHKCLEKEREDRWQSAHDVAEELKWIATVPAAQQQKGAPRGAKIAFAAAAILALALAAMTALWLRARNAPQPRAAFSMLPPEGHYYTNHVLSPDGTMIAFTSRNAKDEGGLWVRRVGEIQPKQLTSDPRDYVMAWSPDSTGIAYMSFNDSGRRLQKIGVSGGTPEVLSSRVGGFSGNAAWGPDGTILMCRQFGEGITALRQDGSEPVPITTLDAKRRESFHGWPRFLPDGKRFLYIAHTIAERKNEIWAGSLDRKLKKQIVVADALVGVALGQLFFVRDGAIYAQRFDAGALTLEGQPRRVVEQVRFEEAAVSAKADVGANGALLYRPVSTRRVELAWYDRSGARTQLLFSGESNFPRTLSPDGTRVATTKWDFVKGAFDIFVVDLARGTTTRVTSGLSHNESPRWSPDGERIYFLSDRDGPYDIYVQAADGMTPAEVVVKTDMDKGLLDVSPDGTSLLIVEGSPESRGDIVLVPLQSPGKRKTLVGTEAEEVNGSFSPDGRWLAYVSDRSGRPELYMRPLAGGRITQISTTGVTGYAWNSTGAEIVVRTMQNQRFAVPLAFSGDTVLPGKPEPLFIPPTLDHSIIDVRDQRLAMWTVPDPSDYVDFLHYESAPRP